MSESKFTKSIQFWVDPAGILKVAEVMEKSEFANCIVGTDEDAVVLEVDYDPSDIARCSTSPTYRKRKLSCTTNTSIDTSV